MLSVELRRQGAAAVGRMRKGKEEKRGGGKHTSKATRIEGKIVGEEQDG